RLSQLKGKRIAVGPVGSAIRFSPERLLGRSGVDSTTATLLPFGERQSRHSMKAKWMSCGSLDRRMHRVSAHCCGIPRFDSLSFPMADAFTRVFPDLVRLVLSQGVIDLDRITPPNDVVLIGTTAKVLVRNDLHPQI